MDDNSSPSDLDLHRKAIDAALNCNWEKAENLNKQIIKDEPKNVACLNRLARALFELGKYQQAKKIYQIVLELDPYNSIAQKNLKKAATFKKNVLKTDGMGKQLNAQTTVISPALFLEEAGVTKIVNLIKVAEPQRLSRLYPGWTVKLVTKNRGISVTDENDNYLGVLADDTSHLLLKLIKGGNKYAALIKSVKPNGVTLLIRETFRSKKFRNQPSFLDSSSATTYSSDHISLSYDETLPETIEQESEETII